MTAGVSTDDKENDCFSSSFEDPEFNKCERSVDRLFVMAYTGTVFGAVLTVAGGIAFGVGRRRQRQRARTH